MKLEELKGNSRQLTIKSVEVLFSYETPIAFQKGNDVYRLAAFYGPTTAKHYNAWMHGRLPSKLNVLNDNEFNNQLEKAL